MSSARSMLAAARADFLERVRRYSFLFTLGFALYFGYLATIGKFTLRVGDLRGVYNSAWIGALLAVIGSTFISLAGFYFVKNTLQRDRETRVGQILAATPLSRTAYIYAKFASNFAVLGTMIAILALSSVVMLLVSGEDRHLHLWKLLSPFLLLSLPAMAVVAAVAILFESVSFLRGGFGNVAYFFLWTGGISMPVITESLAVDLSGLGLLRHSLVSSSAAPAAQNSFAFSLEFGQIRAPVAGFTWQGIAWTNDVVLSRLAILATAFAICGVATLLFDRFDPGGARHIPESAPLPPGAIHELTPAPVFAPIRTLSPFNASARHSQFLAILRAEVRLLLKGRKWWWYTVALGFLIATAAVPNASARGIFLACAWIWPILLWSPMGTRDIQHQTSQLLYSAPHPLARQLPATWLAGVLLALGTGAGFAARALLEGNFSGVFAWLVGALFIPTAALALGTWSGSSKPFEIIYTLLWYVGPMHAFPALDFMGSAPATAATRYPLMYLFAAGVLALAAVAGRKFQLRRV